jgi:ribosomal protein L40E
MVAPAVQAPPPSEPLPAGLAPEDVAPSRPSFRDRGRLRRRLRYLRRVRELGFRDLGGLVFDLHRFVRRNDELVLGKLAALDAVDRELRAIERVLDERRDIIELREPGVAACPRCGALHGSDARFCPQCGTQFSGPLAMVEVGGPTAPADAPATTAAPVTAAEASAAGLSAETIAATPVSGALAGNPVPEGPPAPPAPETPEATDAAAGAPSAEQPTAAIPAVGDDATPPASDVGANGEHPPAGGGPASAPVTSGDPLAPRDRPDA